MSYTVLARKYRPQTFTNMLGQEHIRTALQNSFKNEKLGHAYLFYGPRGVGKTSSARLLAKLLNCENRNDCEPCNECSSCREITAGNSMDVLEIDAASNRGIDNIRNLRENVKFMPLSGQYKVYIIDEVHMLTIESFNALLKTLEEPPPHVKFIFATTEYQKIPATILSRCQEFHFHRLKPELLLAHIESILQKEEIPYEKEALFWVVDKADGSVRDCLSLLDQAIAFCNGNIRESEVRTLLGLHYQDSHIQLMQSILQNKPSKQGMVLKEVLLDGSSLKDFIWSFLTFLRAHQYVSDGVEDPFLIGVPASHFEKYRQRVIQLPATGWSHLVQSVYHLYHDLSRMGNANGLEEKLFIEIRLQILADEISRPDMKTVLAEIERLSKLVAGEAAADSEPEEGGQPDSSPQQSNQPPAAQPVPTTAEVLPAQSAQTPEPAPHSDTVVEKTEPADAEKTSEEKTAPSAVEDEPINESDLKESFLGTDVTEEKTDLGI